MPIVTSIVYWCDAVSKTVYVIVFPVGPKFEIYR